MKQYPLTDSWRSALEGWTNALKAAGRSSATIETRAEHIRRFSRQTGAGAPGLVSRTRLTDWAGSHDWAVETRRGIYNSLRGFYRWALETGVVSDDITDALPVVRPKRPQPRPVPEREYRTALTEADDRTRVILLLAGEAGLRRGEIAQINRRDIMEDLDGLTLLVHGKGNKERYVPLSPHVAAAVTSYLGLREWLLPSPAGGHLTPRHVGKLASRILPGIWTLHTLRHRFGTQVHRATRDVVMVKELLGHESLATTQRYIAVDRSELRRAVMSIA